VIELRSYQVEARDAVIAGWNSGKLGQIVVMSTGTGKTEVALGTLQSEIDSGALTRALVIVHTDELVNQPVERIIANWPGIPTPGIVKAERNEYDKKIVVATIQSLWSQGTMRRLHQIIEAGQISHVWVDETHRVEAATYKAAINLLKQQNPNLRILGTTATPVRSDGVGLRGTYDAVAYQIGIKRAIFELGAITDFDAYAVEVDADISDLRTNADGNFQAQKLGERLSAHKCNEAIIDRWKELAASHCTYRPTIAFTASVAQAYALRDAFIEAGIVAVALDGTTKQKDRQRMVGAFRTGEPWQNGMPIQVVVNCQVFTEGFDAPRASCVIIAKPTRHDGTYAQMAGRVLRKYDKESGWADDLGNTKAIIIDVVPKYGRSLVLAGDLLGEPKAVRSAKENATEQGMINPELFAVETLADGIDAGIDPDATFFRILDLFGSASLAWFYGDGFASVGLGGVREGVQRILTIVMGDDERIAKALALKEAGRWRSSWDSEYVQIQYRVYLVEYPYKKDWLSEIRFIGAYYSFEDASTNSEHLSHRYSIPALSKKDRRWRKQKASEGQYYKLGKMGIQIDRKLSMGDAATYISHGIARAALKKAGVL
jgi:superfamily II DNA or RNA helicase